MPNPATHKLPKIIGIAAFVCFIASLVRRTSIGQDTVLGTLSPQQFDSLIEAMIAQEGRLRGTTTELPNHCLPASSSED